MGGPPRFLSLGQGEIITADDLKKVFNVTGLRNSARQKNEIDYKGFSVKNSQFAELHDATFGVDDVEILAVPVPGPYTFKGGINGDKPINPWFYDASSTNRHNKTGFDLWAEINVGGKTEVIANWKK